MAEPQPPQPPEPPKPPQPPEPPAPPEPPQPPEPEKKSYSQAELDAMVERGKAQERKKFEKNQLPEDQLKKFQEWQKTQKTPEELKAEELMQKTQAENDLKKKSLDLDRKIALIDLGITDKDNRILISVLAEREMKAGDDEEAFNKYAAAAWEKFKDKLGDDKLASGQGQGRKVPPAADTRTDTHNKLYPKK